MAIDNNYRVKRAVQIPHLKLVEGESYDLLFQSEIQTVPSPNQWDTSTMEVCEVMELATGELKSIVVPAVLKGHLEEEGDYVGNAYRVQVGAIENGKKYRQFGLYLLEVDPDADSDG